MVRIADVELHGPGDDRAHSLDARHARKVVREVQRQDREAVERIDYARLAHEEVRAAVFREYSGLALEAVVRPREDQDEHDRETDAARGDGDARPVVQ